MKNPKQDIFDRLIAPLENQIYEICEIHKISMLSAYGVGQDPNIPENQIVMTSALLDPEYDPTVAQLTANDLLNPDLDDDE